MEIEFFITNGTHMHYAKAICDLIEISAKMRGTGIAQRELSYLKEKITSGNSIIALNGDRLVGFCYIEIWSHGRYVVNSGLIVDPDFRGHGIARTIKNKVFDLARNKYPDAKVFGITTSAAVMKVNSELGYRPVTFSELPQDKAFWKSCQSCPNFDILQRNKQQMCLCTGMLALSKIEEQLKELTKNGKTK